MASVSLDDPRLDDTLADLSRTALCTCFRYAYGADGLIKVFTVEIRWLDRDYVEDPWWVGDGEKFIADMVKQSADFCRASVRQFGCVSEVWFNDTWKPITNDRSMTMQRLFTIEIRVDFRDEDKLPLMQKAIQQAARHVYSQAGLLGEAVKPEVVIYSHDYFAGHSDIPLFDDDIASGAAAITEAGNSALTAGEPASAGAPVAKDETPFSQELVNALK